MTKQDIDEIDAFLFDDDQGDAANENDLNSQAKNFQTPNFGGGVKRFATNP